MEDNELGDFFRFCYVLGSEKNRCHRPFLKSYQIIPVFRLSSQRDVKEKIFDYREGERRESFALIREP